MWCGPYLRLKCKCFASSSFLETGSREQRKEKQEGRDSGDRGRREERREEENEEEVMREEASDLPCQPLRQSQEHTAERGLFSTWEILRLPGR